LQTSHRRIDAQALKIMKSNSNSVLPNLPSASVHYQYSGSQILNLTPDTSKHAKGGGGGVEPKMMQIDEPLSNMKIKKSKGMAAVSIANN